MTNATATQAVTGSVVGDLMEEPRKKRPAGGRNPGEPTSKPDICKDSYECGSDVRFLLRERWREAMIRGRTRNCPRLVAGVKLTGLSIAQHLNIATGRCDPSIPALEVATDQSNGTVKSAITTLKAVGALRRGGDDGRGARMFALVDPDEWAAVAPDVERREQRSNRAVHCPIDPFEDRAAHCPIDPPNRAISPLEPGSPLPANKRTGGIASRRSLNKEVKTHSESDRALAARDAPGPDEQPPSYGPPATEAEMEGVFEYLSERADCFDVEDEFGVDEIESAW